MRRVGAKRRLISLAAAAVVLVDASSIWAADAEVSRADVNALVQAVLTTHPRGDERGLAARMRRAARTFGGDTPDQRIASLLRIAAASKDNTTTIYLYQAAIGYSTAPVYAYDFDDGLTIVRTAPQLAELLNTRVVRIAGHPLDVVRKAVDATISSASDTYRRALLSRRILSPELLFALKLSKSRDRFGITVQKENGALVQATLGGSRDATWLSFRGRSRRSVSDAHLKRHFWVKEVEGRDAVLAEVTVVRDESDGRSLSDFATALATMLALRPTYRLVLDFRYGGGGSGHSMGPIIEAVANSPQAQTPGAIYGIIGRYTSGTVLELVSVLRNNSPIVLVGESASAGPNGVGDPTQVELPDSKIQAYVTEVEWPTTLKEEGDSALAPDVAVPNLAADYLANKDRALEVALTSSMAWPSGPLVQVRRPDAWLGTYAIGPGQFVEIDSRDGQLQMRLHDVAGWVGRNFISARTPLFAGPDESLVTLLNGVAVVRTGDRLNLSWRGHTRAMAPTNWTYERVVVGASVALGTAGVLLLWWIRRHPARTTTG